MNPPRTRPLFVAVCCLWGSLAAAQLDSAAPGGTGAGSPATGGGASSSFGAPAAPTSGMTGSTPATPAFRTNSAPASFSIPGLYGRGGLQFTVGEGRLSRPRFRTSASVSIGYDDNVFQTPTNARGTPDQVIQVPEESEQPAAPAAPAIDPATGMATTPAAPAEVKFRTETIPGIPAPKRIGSFITRTELDFDVQFASRRTLFTFDLNGGVGYYWDRPGKKEEYNGSLALIYLRRLTGRAQFTTSVSASYRDQPDFSQVNSPTTNSRGSYLTLDAKADLSYRLTPRFSTVTSVGYNSIYSVEESSQSGNFSETTFGTELRYLFSPRLTLLGEVRYSSQMYESEDNSSQTLFLLAGGELTLSRRFTATLRLGEQLRTFENGNDPSSAPYVEGTLAYRLARATTVQMNARYGFEASADGGNSETTVARLGLTVSQIFTPRLLGSLSLNLLRSTTTSQSEEVIVREMEQTSTGTTTNTTPSTGTAGSTGSTDTDSAEPEPLPTRTVTNESTQDTVDATLALQYALSRRWSFNLNYSYTLALGPTAENDYYRQRIFLGAEYRF